MFGTLSKMIANAVYASSFVSWMFYVGAAVEMFTTGTGIAVRSIASNVVMPDEVGKLNALLGLVESLEPTLYAPIYLSVWDATRDTFTVAFLLVSIALISPALIIFWWMWRINRKLSEAKEEEVGEKNTELTLPQAVTTVPEKTSIDSESTYL